MLVAWIGAKVQVASSIKSGAPALPLLGPLSKRCQLQYLTPADKAPGEEHYAVSNCNCAVHDVQPH